MSRPASDMDQRLLDAGIALLTEGGLDAVDVRSVCQKAGANPGLFHYYFRSKRAFLDRAMDQAFAAFFEALQQTVAAKGEPEARLEAALVTLGTMALKHRALLGSLARSATGKGKAAHGSLPQQVARLGAIMEPLVALCRPRGSESEASFIHLALVESAIAAPLLWGSVDRTLGAGARPHRLSAAELQKNAFSEAAIRRRVRLAMQSLLA